MFNPIYTNVLNSHYLYSKNKKGIPASSSDNLDDKDKLKSLKDDKNDQKTSEQNFELRKNSVSSFFNNVIAKFNNKNKTDK